MTKVVAPSISLPKGGGAIRGIGEKFGANPVTGTGSMSLPLSVTPGRAGFGPQLALTYDSGAGNGPFGFGWSLSLPAITRKTDKGLPQYRDADESDVYVLSGAEDLVPAVGPNGNPFADHTTAPGFVIHRYRLRIETLWLRLERWTRVDTGEIHWRSITGDNVTTVYGKDANSRVADPSDPSGSTRIFSWLICQSHDDKGNAIVYEYAAENDDNVDLTLASERNRVRTASRYLKRIRYGNRVSRLIQPDLTQTSWLFEVVFDYNEGHCQEVGLDPDVPEDAQHRFVRASASAAGSWPVRPDPFSSHRAGFEVRTYRRCHRVLMFHHVPDLSIGEKGYDGLVRSTEFDYADLDYGQPVTTDDELAHQGSTRYASFIRAVTQSGYVLDRSEAVVVENGLEYLTYLKKSFPPVEFDYSKAAIQDQILELDATSLENLPAGLDGTAYQWVDLDGEGVSGILTEQAGEWYYKPNVGEGRFGPLEAVSSKPLSADLNSGRQQLLDLAGNGQLDLVALDGSPPGFYERARDDTWEPFRAFRALPNIPWDEPSLRFVDLDGDGHADILITEQDVFTWHPSLAEDGFGPARRVRQPPDEERGPRLVFGDGTDSIYLADMCGDGLADIVRIRNGEVCYWPNGGYGRFGGKVAMDNAPWFDNPDQFDHRRVRLADIDGSGVNDIIYLARDGVRLYLNQSGNRWSDARPLPQFPRVDNVSAVMAADILGNGTACLVWSSPMPNDAPRRVRYIDLMGGTKPHLLVRSVNNLGAETEVQYASSTQFYLSDKRANRPWITRLSFPVHVIERVVTSDRISGNRFVTRYAYHHGHFDGVEREFRGFGLVEQWDTEEYAALNAGGQALAATNVEPSSHVPPVCTKTWFHTGVYVGRQHVSDFFAGLVDLQDVGEYYREPGLTDQEARLLLLEDTPLPAELTVEEEREACRALKGMMLRQEVYALDGTEKEEHPYTVGEQSFTIRTLQRRGDNRHAVFFTHARESISYHYERDPADPRVQHALTLEVDDVGNVLKSAAIGYGRRETIRIVSEDGGVQEVPNPGLNELEPRDRENQTRPLVTYTENRVTKAIDNGGAYRTPRPAEMRVYELTGYPATDPSGRYQASDLVTPDPADPERKRLHVFDSEIDYERQPLNGRERRLIEQVRTLYRRDDLAGLLGMGEMEPLALDGESFELALTPGLLSQVFQRDGQALVPDPAATLGGPGADRGGYVDLDGNGCWWTPSGRTFFSPGTDDTSAQELAHARQHFFLPHRYRDPFHSATTPTDSFVTYDAYDLLVQETRDALDNRVTVGERSVDPTQPPVRVGHDYRVFQSALVMDPNRNRSVVAFDAFGMVVGTAVMGKPEEAPAPGDAIADTFRADLTQAEIEQFLANPKGPMAATLLDLATTRTVYDVTRYWRESDATRKRPAVAAALARETHSSDPAPPGGVRIQASFSYSDGFGREIQKKIQAESGPAPQRDAEGRIVVGANQQPVMTESDVSPRWVGSGWKIFNNKGNTIRQYEPFFTDTHGFEFDVRAGVSPTLFYDPLERVVATLHPSHAWEKVVFSAWRRESWDRNDTLLVADPKTDSHVGDFFRRLPDLDYLPSWYSLRTEPDEKRAAEKAAVHAATPTRIDADSLGRPFLTVAHNKFKYSDSPPADPPIEEFHHTRILLDIEGNEREVVDALDRVVMRYDYDMLGNRIHQASMDSGERWMLNEVTGKPLYAWDSRDHRLRGEYDQLRRLTSYLWRTGLNAETVVERDVYGDTRPNAEAKNLRGKLVQLMDQAGIVMSDEYDFKGNLRRRLRRLAKEFKAPLDWSTVVALEEETFTSRTRYDAFNRATQLIAPHGDQTGATVNVIEPIYNDGNLLEQVHAWLNQNAEPEGWLDPSTADLHAVADIDYDASGRRTQIHYGNGAATLYEYDPLSSRLTRLTTSRPPNTNGLASQLLQHPSTVQDLRYTYDSVGSILQITDDALWTIFHSNEQVAPVSRYTYDAVYRLIEATGREHVGQSALSSQPATGNYRDHPFVGAAQSHDPQAVRAYTEQYRHDPVGNFDRIVHRAANGNWTRVYRYKEPSQLEVDTHVSNRLSSTTLGDTDEVCRYDGSAGAHGNMTAMPHLPLMRWDYRDHLHATAQQAVNHAATPETTWYVYDAGGERVRKVTEWFSDAGQAAKRKSEDIYLGGFEIHREYESDGSSKTLERETLHIVDDKQRIALVETRTEDLQTMPKHLIRYQVGNHLGSSCLELDDRARIISYEEYFPYGSTSYQVAREHAEAPKRYRYTGKERDEQSGFSYHHARYYAPWLGRWVSADPMGLVDGSNLYAYVRANPIGSSDPTGTRPPTEEEDAEQFQGNRVVSALDSRRKKAEENLNEARKHQAFAFKEFRGQASTHGLPVELLKTPWRVEVREANDPDLHGEDAIATPSGWPYPGSVFISKDFKLNTVWKEQRPSGSKPWIVYHEMVHAVIDYRARFLGDPHWQEFVDRGTAYYKDALRTSGETIGDPSRMFQEAAAEYVEARISRWWETYKDLEEVLQSEQKLEQKLKTIRRLERAYERNMAETATEAYGYEFDLLGRERRTTKPISAEMKTFIDANILEGRIGDKFADDLRFQQLLKTHSINYPASK